MGRFVAFAVSITAAVGCLLAARNARAQDVSLAGKVSDAAGKPLAGVVVKLLNARLSDTTGADGAYSFAGKTNGVTFRLPFGSRVDYARGRFRVVSRQARELALSLHDARGTRVAQVFRGRVESGVTEIPFDVKPWGGKILFLRAASGGTAVTRRLAKAGADETHAGFGASVADQPSSARTALSQAAAGAASAVPNVAADWLQAYKPGFGVYAQPIDSYAGTRDITLGPAAGPDLGPNAILFDPTQSMQAMQSRIDAVHALMSASQFPADHYAFLFKPGAYALNVDVDYNEQAAGLGQSPDDVAITGSVRSIASTAQNNVTLEFWRAAENMQVTPSSGTDTWAVSQGAPFRRMHVKGNLAVSLGGWASGGFLADSKVEGQVGTGSQQQWFTRNTEMNSWSGGVWNMAFVGCPVAPAEGWPSKPYTVAAAAPMIREKPFLNVDKSGNWQVTVPSVQRDAVGASWTQGAAAGEDQPLGLYYIAHAETDDATTLNAALAQGRNLLLTPGTYHLDQSLMVSRPDAVILGIGMPSLIADNGNAVLSVADVDGVKIAGLLIDAGATDSPTLVQIGPAGSSKDHSSDPTSLHDIFVRVGGPRAGTATSAVTLNSNDVIVDHFWLWRADHGAGAGWTSNKSKHGLIVNGARVTAYGLFVEHFQEYQVLWNGEGGRTYFYQSEMPYDPPSQSAWSHDGIKGYASYKVSDGVKTHQAEGLGIYCAFYPVAVESDHAIEAPTAPGVVFHHAMTSFLSSAGGGINNVLNSSGGPVSSANKKAYLPE